MFEEIGILGSAMVLFVALIALVRSSDFVVTNAVKIADRTGFGRTTIGFLLVAFSTTLPELFVSVFSALDPTTIGVALGNALGSNVTNIGLILGICFLIVTLRKSGATPLSSGTTKEEIRRLHFGLFIASIVPLTLLYIGSASQFIGVILFGIFAFNVYMLSKVKNNKNGENIQVEAEKAKFKKAVALFAAGAAGVVASAYFIVNSASFIAESLGVPSVVIGGTIIAFGTSVPELANSITSTQKGHLDLALGNIVGACFINITLILGVALIASPLSVEVAAFSNVAIFSLITTLFLWYFLSSERISWREGAMLLMLYVVFVVTSYGGYKTA
ncbi:MAG: sodium:calcium antiporter [Candidatus Bathyarchaeota archaeon]|nr:sodium:calcium antiporter [Candidatus Bathyarchaeota archaeon]